VRLQAAYSIFGCISTRLEPLFVRTDLHSGATKKRAGKTQVRTQICVPKSAYLRRFTIASKSGLTALKTEQDRDGCYDQLKTIGRGALFALVAASATIASTSTYAVPGYDGLWSVSIVTEKRCLRPRLSLSDPHFQRVLANAGDVAVNIAGKVMPTGAITVMVSAAGKSANGTGRLSGNLGEGSWSGGDCSGTWTAERRS